MMRIIIWDLDTQFLESFEKECRRRGVECVLVSSIDGLFAKAQASCIFVIAKEQGAIAEAGLTVLESLRKNPKLTQPIVLTSKIWGKPDFAKHQKTASGANGYYSKSSPIVDLFNVIESVTGESFSISESSEKEKTRTLNVRAKPAVDVVNIREEVSRQITIEVPIDVFGSEESVVSTVKKTPASENVLIKTNATAAIKVREPTKFIETAPQKTKEKKERTSIDLTFDPGAEGLTVEVAGRGGTRPLDEVKHTTEGEDVSGEASIALELSEADVRPDTDTALEIPKSSEDAVEPIELPAEMATIASSPESSENDVETVAGSGVSEEEAAKDLPYLFSNDSMTGSVSAGLKTSLSLPTLSAPLPVFSGTPSSSSGAESSGASSAEVETLKKYLTMREHDISVLVAQLTYAKEELGKSEETIRRLSLSNEDHQHQIDSLKQRVSTQDQELQHAGKSLQVELDQLRFDLKTKIDRIKFLEDRLSDSGVQYEKLKERVRHDIRKIRVREKELESKLEILKKDSETLIAARENKILELKRKIDLLEFNFDTLQDKNEQEKQNSIKAKEKIDRVMKVIRLAIGVLETDENQIAGDSSKDNAA